MNAVKVIVGVVAAAAAGTVFGILYAPARGSLTRKSILHKGEAKADSLKNKYNEFIDSILCKFDRVKEEVVDFTEEIMPKADEIEKSAKSALKVK
jgi:gas vesicle protein